MTEEFEPENVLENDDGNEVDIEAIVTHSFLFWLG